MSIHPLRTLRYDNEEHQKGISASIRDLERLGPDHYVGYSYAWLANLYTVEKNGQKARDTLHLFSAISALRMDFISTVIFRIRDTAS